MKHEECKVGQCVVGYDEGGRNIGYIVEVASVVGDPDDVVVRWNGEDYDANTRGNLVPASLIEPWPISPEPNPKPPHPDALLPDEAAAAEAVATALNLGRIACHDEWALLLRRLREARAGLHRDSDGLCVPAARYRAVVSERDEARAAPAWRPVTATEPASGDTVLAVRGRRVQLEVRWLRRVGETDTDRWVGDTGVPLFAPPDAWMPLPEVPRG